MELQKNKTTEQNRHHINPKTDDDSHRLGLLCTKAALDKKATHLTILDIRKDSAFADTFVICSVGNERQGRAVADSIETAMRESGLHLRSLEGYSEGRWVLMDFGDIVVHIFLEPIRDFYRLEEIWKTSPSIEIPPEYYYSPA